MLISTLIFGIPGVVAKIGINFAESFIDNVIRDRVKPKVGSILYCELAFGDAEHSGIYIGNKEIVHLDGSGEIEIVSPEMFMSRLGGLNSAMTIYISCKDSEAVGSLTAARRAREMVGQRRDYSLLTDNCHQFVSGCITGEFENADNFLWMLKHTVSKEFKAESWRAWEKKDTNFVSDE